MPLLYWKEPGLERRQLPWLGVGGIGQERTLKILTRTGVRRFYDTVTYRWGCSITWCLEMVGHACDLNMGFKANQICKLATVLLFDIWALKSILASQFLTFSFWTDDNIFWRFVLLLLFCWWGNRAKTVIESKMGI